MGGSGGGTRLGKLTAFTVGWMKSGTREVGGWDGALQFLRETFLSVCLLLTEMAHWAEKINQKSGEANIWAVYDKDQIAIKNLK